MRCIYIKVDALIRERGLNLLPPEGRKQTKIRMQILQLVKHEERVFKLPVWK